MNAVFALGNRASAEEIRTRLTSPPSDSSVRVNHVNVVVDADGRTTFYRLKDPLGETAMASVTGGEQLLAEVKRFRQQPARRVLSPTFFQSQSREEMERLRTLGYVG